MPQPRTTRDIENRGRFVVNRRDIGRSRRFNDDDFRAGVRDVNLSPGRARARANRRNAAARNAPQAGVRGIVRRLINAVRNRPAPPASPVTRRQANIRR